MTVRTILTIALLALQLLLPAVAFQSVGHPSISTKSLSNHHYDDSSSTALSMGWLDNLFNAKTFPKDAKVTARHILCSKRAEAEEAKKKYRKNNFAQLAKEYSTCPSAARGGNLGTFSPGMMVPDFDEAVFDPEVTKIGELTGPIMTPFGYHLIIVDKRTGV